MVGYRGVGGEIDGVRNPTLWARTGETVRITIINGELMVHDIALEKLGIKSTQILDKGATTSITFKAEQSDTYFCSVPGHRLAGMEGRLDVSDEPRAKSEGTASGRRTAGRSTSISRPAPSTTGPRRAMRSPSRVTMPGRRRDAGDADARRARRHVSRHEPGRRQRAPKGSLSSAPFKVTHPYASFLVSGGALQQHARRAGARRRQPADLHASPVPTRPRCGPRWWIFAPTPTRTSSSVSWTTETGASDGGLPQGEPVGAHQLRSFPLPHDAAVLPERDHAVRHQHHAADGSGAPRRACPREKRPAP